MNAERMAIYGNGSPKGFQRITHSIPVDRDKQLAKSSLPKSYYPRAKKQGVGENFLLCRVTSGVAYQAGDIILDLDIETPTKSLRWDVEVIAAGKTFCKGNDCQTSDYRYMLVRRANADNAAECRRIADAHSASVMSRAMNS